MPDDAAPFSLPPVTSKPDGSTRVVGFELEFSGITLDQAANALEASLGAELQSESAAERRLFVDGLGDFNVELDWNYLKLKADEDAQGEEQSEWLDKLSELAALLVPIEVVCPPIPMTGLGVLHPMVDALREAGAVGTEESLLAAYGVHINAEIPRLDADTLFDYLRAFAILQWWLVEAHDVDPARKISPYIDLYPTAYVKKLLSRSAATMDVIFDEYLEHNASRNRALDLLPLLAEIDSDRVRRAVDDSRIKARPAFHYRLPNCHIERADWSLAASWNNWCVVEGLAGRHSDLDDLSAEFLSMDRPILGVSRKAWREIVQRWLSDHELV